MKTYLTYLLVGFLLLISVFLVITIKPILVYAVTINQTNATTTVTVNSAVDISIVNVSISFGSLDPGVSASGNANDPLLVRINTNTNTKTNLSMKGAGNFTDGSNTFFVGNLSYRNSSATTPRRNFTESYISPCCEFANWNDTAAPGSIATNISVYYWVTIPPAQVASTYVGNVTIRTGIFN